MPSRSTRASGASRTASRSSDRFVQEYRVAHSGQAEKCVLPASKQQEQHEARPYDCVEQRQHIGTDDLPKAAAGGIRRKVAQAVAQPGNYFASGEARRGWPGYTSVVELWSLAPASCHPLIVVRESSRPGDAAHRNVACLFRRLRVFVGAVFWCGGGVFGGVGVVGGVDLCGGLVGCIVVRVAAAVAESLRPTP